MIRVLIADDSAFMRQTLSDLFTKSSDFEVVGTASNGEAAIEKTKILHPDVLTMDVNMPVMDGLDALAIIMEECPTPVVMISSLTQEGTDATIRALSLGAVDFISKAGGEISRVEVIEGEILEKCKAAASARVFSSAKLAPKKSVVDTHKDMPKLRHIALPIRTGLKLQTEPKETALAPPKPPFGAVRKNPLLGKKKPLFQPKAVQPSGDGGNADKLVAIGVSTGGPQALQQVIPNLPKALPCGVLVVQHMAANFTKSLADRLNAMSEVTVTEAQDGERIEAGHVYVAPGGTKHLRVKTFGKERKIVLDSDPPIGNHRPAVNALYDSIAELGTSLVAVILTGMGADGCEGMKKIKAHGGYCIAQDEATCVVYGMPKAVAEAGILDEVRPVQEMASAIVKAVKR